MSRPINFFAPSEWYHCYSRGIDKRIVFESVSDYQRFISLLYLTNTTTTLHRSNLENLKYDELFTVPRKEPLVDIGAYALMPNHFHLLLYEKSAGSISRFMQKLGTAYTMYFNIKCERSGGLFTKPFRARHVSDDHYFQYVVDYIHLNPLKLFEPKQKEQKEGKGLSRRRLDNRLVAKLETYPFSSLPDFNRILRPNRAIIGKEIFEIYQKKTTKQMLENALAYKETFPD